MKQTGLSKAGGAGVKGEEMEQVPGLRGWNPHPNTTVFENTAQRFKARANKIKTHRITSV